MQYDCPFYRYSDTPPFEHYTTRLLVGIVGSLAVSVAFVHVPLSPSTPASGWSQRSMERIALTEVQADRERQSETAEHPEEAPPPTQHARPSSSSSSGSSSESESRARTENKEPEDSPSSPRPIAELSTEDQHPEIIGGSGALYLQIHYPREARRQGIEGRLKVEFTVSKTGKARAVEVAKSLHPLCDSAAVQALRSVRFRPATYNDNPIPVRMSLPIRFQIRSEGPTSLSTDRSSASGE